MTWEYIERSGYQGHFLDGYVGRTQERAFRRLMRQSPTLLATAIETTERARAPPYDAILPEHNLDKATDHRSWIILADASSGAPGNIHEFVDGSRFRLKESDAYADYAAFAQDAQRLLSNLLNIYLQPEMAVRAHLQDAGLPAARSK